jgi:SagB-type dehydrogenase family enzyme
VKSESRKIRLNPVNTSQNFVKILQSRISYRNFKKTPLKKEQVSLILWSAGGVKLDAVSSATRTIPSAGAIYPLELYLVVGDGAIDEIKEGIYHYVPAEHSLERQSFQDIRKQLSVACLGQGFIADAPVSVVVAAEYGRMSQRYRQRGVRYVYLEAGHACQNIYLAVTDLGLGTVEVGAFYDAKVKNILGLDDNIEPLIIMPIGYID